jgi:aryl sulfotransferase
VGPPFDPPATSFPEYFHTWLDRDGFPLWPFWSHVQSWWDVRGHSNVLLLHYNDMKADLGGQMRRIARFLNIELNEAVWPSAIAHCTFSYMKENGWKLSALLDAMLIGGVESFIHKGVSGDWQGQLDEHEILKYEEHATANLTPDCRAWLASGGTVPGMSA